ncbi:hypothetical protein ACVW0I_007847 [Bradyrhizobium sp. LM6.11]
MMQQSLNVAYSDGSSQVLWEDGERVFSRGWRPDDNGNRLAVLLVAPAADQPFPVHTRSPHARIRAER